MLLKCLNNCLLMQNCKLIPLCSNLTLSLMISFKNSSCEYRALQRRAEFREHNADEQRQLWMTAEEAQASTTSEMSYLPKDMSLSLPKAPFLWPESLCSSSPTKAPTAFGCQRKSAKGFYHSRGQRILLGKAWIWSCPLLEGAQNAKASLPRQQIT